MLKIWQLNAPDDARTEGAFSTVEDYENYTEFFAGSNSEPESKA